MGGGAIIVLDDLRALTIAHNGRRQRYRTWGRNKWHPAELQATVDAVRTGAPEPIPFREVVAGMRATFAVRASLASGEPVAVT